VKGHEKGEAHCLIGESYRKRNHCITKHRFFVTSGEAEQPIPERAFACADRVHANGFMKISTSNCKEEITSIFSQRM
jgi:hypothetical protein